MNHLEKDLAMASEIQQSLLPPQDLEWCGWSSHFRYMPAGPVSGDYCDLVTAAPPGDDLWFVIADVSGKGVAAALRMAHLNAAFRTTIASGVEVGELAARMNRMMAETAGSQYASLVAGRARGDGSVELCNAGHPPPIVRRRGGIGTIQPGGYPLGLIGTGSYATESLRLEPGESLLLYTDGITEARNKAGEEYGPERLGTVLLSRENGSACDLAAACVDDHRVFADSGPAQDDRTLLVLRRAA
jgi:sigma-B regulation protein RsbU (phosphoserine phosphatase)